MCVVEGPRVGLVRSLWKDGIMSVAHWTIREHMGGSKSSFGNAQHGLW